MNSPHWGEGVKNGYGLPTGKAGVWILPAGGEGGAA